MCIFFALWDQNLARYSIFMPKNEVNQGFCFLLLPPIRILRFSDFARKSSFGIFWGVENFFWKIFFVVKISTTKKIFGKNFRPTKIFKIRIFVKSRKIVIETKIWWKICDFSWKSENPENLDFENFGRSDFFFE